MRLFSGNWDCPSCKAIPVPKGGQNRKGVKLGIPAADELYSFTGADFNPY